MLNIRNIQVYIRVIIFTFKKNEEEELNDKMYLKKFRNIWK